MKGTKEFINHTGLHLNVSLHVRRGECIGNILCVHEFCLAPGERRCVNYGNECNPFLDGITAYSRDRDGCTETGLFANHRGGHIDRLLNRNHTIKFLRSAHSIVISSDNC